MDLRAFIPTVWGFSCVHVLSVTTFGMYKFEFIPELAMFGIEGTWFLNSLSVRMLPKNFLIQRMKRVFSKIFTFPYHDTHVIDIILAKK